MSATAAAATNDPFVGLNMDEIIASFSFKRLAVKMVMGFVYGYTLGCCANIALNALALLAMPAWLSFVVTLAVILAMLYVVFVTANPVVDYVYDKGAVAIDYASDKVTSITTWVKSKVTK